MTKLALSLCCLFLLSFGPMAQPAMADQDCTPERMEALSGEMLDVMNKHPGSADHLDEETAKIEAEYGGPPTDAQTCEAFEKLIKALEQY